MVNLEIPMGKRTAKYRFFEMLPAILSYGALILMIVLSIFSPLLAAIYLLLVIVTLLVKAVGIAIRTVGGRNQLEKAKLVNWSDRFNQLSDPVRNYSTRRGIISKEFGYAQHVENLKNMAVHPEDFPKPADLRHAVIIAAYNEDYDVIQPTMQAVVDTTFDNKNLIVILAYEERGGPAIEATAKRLKREFSSVFGEMHIVKHPSDLPNEVVGKGGNITYAGKFLKTELNKNKVPYENVIVTTLDSDNRPHKTYFDYVAYEYIVHEDRKHLSYQPIALFFNNIWDAPAPMRVVATGNSFWNIISSMRPHMLRNFASHSQSMDALVEMDFWSTRTIVEDGHQYWRSYFHFKGDYSVTPIFVPIGQDAVLSDTYMRTLKAQFIQLRRWAYGASDVPYVATNIFTKGRNVPFLGGLMRLIRLIDSHITLAVVAIMVAFGGWVPLLIGASAHSSIIAHQLPIVISGIQKVAMIGLFITIFFAFKLLPPRPERYKRRRNVLMLAQWVLMPPISIGYNAFAALYSQGRLFLGKYLDTFDVTEKATVASIERAKQKKDKQSSKKK